MSEVPRNTFIGKTVLEKYQVIEEIGRGGMGLVYLARDTRLGREVALKELVISKTLIGKNRDDIISRFNREARTTSLLNHPNIVTVFDVGRENQTYFIAMEFLQGKTLKDYLDDNHPFSYEELIDIFSQIASGLSHAHTKGVVHRDIKPENITILAEQTVKIMDFGIASIESSTTNLTQDGSILGTIAYISPEQLYNSKGVDNRSDIFSYGIMMYELLTGQLPFEGDSVGETITKIMTQIPVPPRQINPKLPEKLEAIALKCIQKSPDKRFQHMYEILNELVNYKTSLSYSELQEIVRTDQINSTTLKRKRITRNTPSAAALLSSAVRQRRFKIMYIGEDLALQRLLQSHIKLKGLPYDLQAASSLSDAQRQLSGPKSIDLVIVEFQSIQNIESFAYFEYFVDTPLLFFSDYSNPHFIVDVMKRGAIDFVIRSNPVEDTLKILEGIRDYLTQLDVFISELNTIETKLEMASAHSIASKPVVASGKLISKQTPNTTSRSKTTDLQIEYMTLFGKLGTKPGEFSSPRHIYYCEDFQELLVADSKNSRVQIFDDDGNYLRSLEYPEMTAPCAITRDASGNTYVLDAVSAFVFVFQDQEFSFQFGGKDEGIHAFQSVYGIACFKNQYLLISDPDSHLIKVFNLNGQIEHIIAQGFKNHPSYKKPSALYASEDQIFVLDQGLFNIHILNEQFEHVTVFGHKGTKEGQFGVPKGLSVDVEGFVYVSEALPHRFQVFDSEGNFIASRGTKGSEPEEFNTVDAITVSSNGRIFVLDKENHRVQIFQKK